MEPINLSIAKALEESLRSIQTSDGYHTDLGSNVARGFYSQAISSRSSSFPMVAIQPDSEQTEGSREFANKLSSEMRLVIVTNDTTAPTDVLYRCTADVRRALSLNLAAKIQTLGVQTAPAFGAVEYALAADSHLTLATIAVAFTFVEKYEV